MQALMVGPRFSGKTTILTTLQANMVSPLNSLDQHWEVLHGHHTIRILEAFGNPKLFLSEPGCLIEKHAIIFVVDSSDRKRVKESKAGIDVLLKTGQFDNGFLLILANKKDLPTAMSVEEIYDILGLDRIRKFGCLICKTCANDKAELTEALEILSSRLKVILECKLR